MLNLQSLNKVLRKDIKYLYLNLSLLFHHLSDLTPLTFYTSDIGQEDLLEVNNPLVTGLDYGSNMMLGMSSGPIIPAFWWGCLFGPVGILVVYLVEDDSSQTKSAFWGCLVNVLISGTTTGFYYAVK